MSDVERGDARAQGAFANFLQGMRNELNGFDRSDEYKAQFWATLRAEMANHINGKVN